jgi:putative transposase
LNGCVRWRPSAEQVTTASAPTSDVDEEESRLRGAIQRAALENRQYGYRRVAATLRAKGWGVNHKRVARLMREDNLLAIRKRRFVPRTTDSRHDFEVAVNLARRLTPTAINQLWVADITYLRLGRADVFLAVVMDAYSRKIVGWNLAPTLATELALTALKNAIEARQPAAGLIHHSDRGVQYASTAYLDTLVQHGMIASMSRPGNPYDNAKCERFMKTLKQEEVHCFEYRDIEDSPREPEHLSGSLLQCDASALRAGLPVSRRVREVGGAGGDNGNAPSSSFEFSKA